MTQTSSNKSEKSERIYHVAFRGFRNEYPSNLDICLYYRLLTKICPQIMCEFLYHPRAEITDKGFAQAGIVPLSSANTCDKCGGCEIKGNLVFTYIFRLAQQLNLPTPAMHISTTCTGKVLHANWKSPNYQYG